MTQERTIPPDDRDWALPPKPTIKVNRDELLLLDWTTGSASHLIPNADLDELAKWHEFRMSVWTAIDSLSAESPEADFPLSEADAKILMAVVPTTFRWGTGEDCGYSLKMKLSKFLQGVKK